jgi:hypothetical protein
VGAISNPAEPLEAGVYEPGAARQPGRARSGWARWLEALGVALSPAVAALVLRLRLMAPAGIPDPTMHTIYIVDPHQMLTRYANWWPPAVQLRESARVGFLVPARLAYLAFGAVPGFFFTRYALALIAVGPVYLLLRSLYGRPAGVAGILVVLSSPVVVTAWGTDYPDSAVVSYAIGALACLAMPCAPRWRRAWLAAAGVLLTLAVWSHGTAVALVGAALVGYVGVRVVRDRAGLLGDLMLLAGVAAAVTGLLMAASVVLFGHANFIDYTWQAYRFLSQPSQTRVWHSTNWRWALYVAYLLVLPAVLGAFAVAVARRGRAVPTPVVLIGVMAAVQVVAYVWLQFFGNVQLLEEHYFSSPLWSAVCLLIVITVAELARPLADRPLARWLPVAVLLAVPLVYEAHPHVPPLGWAPFGIILAAAVIAAAAAAGGSARLRDPLARAAAIGVALAVFAGGILVLTVAPSPRHRPPPNTTSDPAPAYASALGGGSTAYIDAYRISTDLPHFVGPATYSGEQLLMWRPYSSGPSYDYAGMYRGLSNTLPSRDPPHLTAKDRRTLMKRRPPELLLFDIPGGSFPRALRELAAFRPTLVRAGELRAGSLVLHVWLVRLGIYYHPPRRR